MTPNLRTVLCVVVSAATLLALLPAQAQTGSPQDTLNQYVSDLKKNPSDAALREKIIKLALELSPAPALPDEAQKHLDRGVAAIEGAKSEEDFNDACAEFTKVLTITPWFGRGYRPLAIAQDKAGQYDAAMKNLDFYLLSQPSSEDIVWAKSLRNKIEYRKEKAAKAAEAKAKESSPQAVAAQPQNAFEDLLRKIDGRRYTCPFDVGFGSMAIDVRGSVFVLGFVDRQGYHEAAPNSRFEISGRNTKGTVGERPPGARIWPEEKTYMISQDGNKITQRVRFNDGDVREYIYLWQR